MDREGFRNRLKQYKKAREENPGLKYWEWKTQPAEKDIPKYDEGTGSVGMPSTTSADGRTKYVYYDPTMDLEYQNINLPEVTITGNKNAGKRLPMSVPEGSYERFKTLGEIGKTVGGFLPVAGEMIDAYDLVTDIKNKDWTNTAIRVGGYLMPNVLEKGFNSANNIYKKLRRYPQINIDNAHEITDSQWDRVYDRALRQNNIEELQRLRDIHFATKSNTNVVSDNKMPIKTYHTVQERYDPNFNVFNTSIEGKPTAIYTTDLKPMSRSYSSSIQTEEELENLLFENLDWYKWLDSREMRSAKSKEDLVEGWKLFLQRHGTREKSVNTMKKRYEELGTDISLHPERTKELYVKLNNSLNVDADNSNWSYIFSSKLPPDVYENINNIPNILTTRDIEQIYKHFGFDGAQIKNVIDYGPSARDYTKLQPGTVYELDTPSQVKYSDYITYDDNGNVIKLSKRDNFSTGDMRYAEGGEVKLNPHTLLWS